jgi:alpha-L-fucosidase
LAGLVALSGVPKAETPSEFAKRTQWWREAKFGMFIHWGVYAVPASARGGAEWYLHGSQVQVKDYEKLAAQFNPVRFDAAKWVRTAKQAGMKYIVITSKHHDGFCMFDTKLTDWSIVRATPFKRDPLKELAAECRKQGVRLCFYHSIMDWHHPDYLPRRPWENDTRPATGASLDRYIDYMKGQLRELLTNYGPIGVIWFDGGWEHTAAELRSEEVNTMIRALQPRIIINDRNQSPEDHSTPEQTIPAGAMPNDRLWETCMTINGTWGYTKDNNDWKTPEDLIRKLCDIAHKGGNFLLNVGPTELGEFPPQIHERFEAMGKWLCANGPAIYATTKSPWRKLPFEGRCTVKGNKVYLHVFQWPDAGLRIVGLKTPVRGARCLATGQRLDVRTSTEGDLPAIAIAKPARLDPFATVVELALAGKPIVVDRGTVVRQGPDGLLRLKAADATIHGSAQYESGGGRDNIGFWTNKNDYVSWEIELTRAGDYQVAVTYACQPGSEGSEFIIGLGRRGAEGLPTGKVQATDSWTDFRTVILGELANVRAGRYTLTVKALAMPNGAVMNLKEVALAPGSASPER